MYEFLLIVPLATTSLIMINILILAAGLLSDSFQITRDYGFIPDKQFHINSIDRSFRYSSCCRKY